VPRTPHAPGPLTWPRIENRPNGLKLGADRGASSGLTRGGQCEEEPASGETGSSSTAPDDDGRPESDYLAASGLRAVMDPSKPTQTAPLAVPGSFRPLPVSELTVALNFSAVGSDAAFFT
jgi:hypothetical protein